MAIKARETITIIKERDVNATWRFYHQSKRNDHDHKRA